MRRAFYWAGVLLGVLLLVGGVVVGALGYAESASPAGVVRGYFRALAAGDAARALAYGDVPYGPRTMLTDTVLREQLRIAPVRHPSVDSTKQHGSSASVKVTYTLAFADEDIPISTTVPLHKHGGTWRLDYVAIPTQLEAEGARQRESIVGAPLPTKTTLLFPGAVPIRFDTPYLQLDGFKDNVTFETTSTTGVVVRVTEQARKAMTAAVRSALEQCVTGPPDGACPLPDQRYVPGSIHGQLDGSPRDTRVSLDPVDPVGVLTFAGKATVVGSYARLNFHNRQVEGTGRIALDVSAHAFAVPPLHLIWAAS